MKKSKMRNILIAIVSVLLIGILAFSAIQGVNAALVNGGTVTSNGKNEGINDRQEGGKTCEYPKFNGYDLPVYCANSEYHYDEGNNKTYKVEQLTGSNKNITTTELRMIRYIIGAYKKGNNQEEIVRNTSNSPVSSQNWTIYQQCLVWNIIMAGNTRTDRYGTWDLGSLETWITWWYDRVYSGHTKENETKFRNIVTTINNEAEAYAKAMANKTTDGRSPSISAVEGAKLEEYGNGTYKVGPFKLDYSSSNFKPIKEIKVDGDKGTFTLASNPYLYANGARGSAIPKSGEEFYIILNGMGNNTKVTKVRVRYTYQNYEDIKLYYLTYTSEFQPFIVAEGKPNIGEAETPLDVNFIEPTEYIIKIVKKDEVFGLAVPNATFSVKVNGKQVQTVKTNSNGVATITLIADNENTDTITITETSVADTEKYGLLSEPIKLSVAKEVKDDKYQVSSITKTKGPGNVDFDAKTDTLTINVEDPAKITGEYELNIMKKDSYDKSALANAEFEVKVNGASIGKYTTNSKGTFTQPIKITITDLEKDTIEITETKAPDKYKKLEGSLKLEVSKKADKNTWTVSVSEIKKVKDFTNVSTTITGTGVIQVEIENKRDLEQGEYTLNINKIDSRENKWLLEGAEFEVKVDGASIGKYTTNSNGTFTEPIKITINEAGIDTIEIIETKAPQYYEELKGSLVLEVKTEEYPEEWTYKVSSITIKQDFKNTEGKAAGTTISETNETHKQINLTIKNERKFIKLSGYVWEDEKASKESTLNGQKDSNEQFISGLKVTIHTSDNENIIYTNSPTMDNTTNNNGYYEFEVPMGPSGYYMEFVYNGQNYQHTKYTPWSKTSSNPNKTSNATETEADRDNLNKALETITPNMVVNGTTISNTINNQGATYIQDKCYTISAYTGAYGSARDITYYYETSEEINLGLTLREKVDLAVRKDVYDAKLSINGIDQTYVYNKRQNLETDTNGNSYWEIEARQSDVYYGTNYEREVRVSDYNYTGENRLKAEVTYKITIRNQSEVADCKVTEIVDYYDQDYTFKKAYVLNGNSEVSLIPSESSRYSHNTNISSYSKKYFDISNYTIKESSDLEIYVVFDVNTDGDGKIILDENEGKGNIVEIMDYKATYGDNAKSPNNDNSQTYTEYKAGDIAGRVDVDSNPGNTTLSNDNTFEDDTDRAPYIKFKLAENARVTNGVVWEDSRTEKVEQSMVGNGIKEDGETNIGNVIVQLYNADTNQPAQVYNGSTWVEATTTATAENGYQITGFIPGRYYLKFTYNDGQNYKSTTYHCPEVNSSFDVNNPDDLGVLVETAERYSDARDLWGSEAIPGTRAYVNVQYSGTIVNNKANSLATELANGNHKIEAVTGLIDVYIEKNQDTNSESGRVYNIDNVDFGIQERAKAQIMLKKEVSNVQVILANGSTLFDASGRATNVMWTDQDSHEYGYDGNLMKQPIVRTNTQQILLTMDEELMHGATIKIAYKITAQNIGEVDYASKQFYYKGQKDGAEAAVTTKVNEIVDYAGAAGTFDEYTTVNDLRFNASENPGWEIITANTLMDNGLVKVVDASGNDITGDTLLKYNTILKYNFNQELLPEIANADQSKVETTLTLSQVMSPRSDADDLTYSNMVELLSFENGIGRKLQYSTVGNQNPDDILQEVDSDLTQVTILPPFGQQYIYYILGAIIAVIMAGGIVIIKKKVINKK